MSDCDRFNKILDSMPYGNISEEDRSFLNSHAEICEKCSEELAFVSNIEKTLHTMPKLEVPDDFMSSLNKKLDLEEKIKKSSFDIENRKIFGSWKKYSALTACLLLAVLAKVDVWDVSSPDNVDEPVVGYSVMEKEDAILVTPAADVVPEDTTYILPVVSESKEDDMSAKASAAVLNETTRNAVSSAAGNSELKQMPVSQITKQEQKPVDAPSQKSEVSSNKPTKVVVVNPGTPHSSAEMPSYVNDPDVKVIYSEPVENTVVKLHDYASVSDEAIQKAFGITDLPDNKVVIATPTAMKATVKAAEEINNSANMVSINTYGAGSLYVPDADRETACKILNRYINSSEDVVLTEENYSLFLQELERKGIRYKKYIVNSKTSGTSIS